MQTILSFIFCENIYRVVLVLTLKSCACRGCFNLHPFYNQTD